MNWFKTWYRKIFKFDKSAVPSVLIHPVLWTLIPLELMLSKCFVRQTNSHYYGNSSMLSHFNNWAFHPLNDTSMTLIEFYFVAVIFRMSQGSFLSNFSSMGACFKIDLLPVNFDLWGQNHHFHFAILLCIHLCKWQPRTTLTLADMYL